MNVKKSTCWKLWLAFAMGLELLTGCIPKWTQWSPDGRMATILTDTGLYLCDSNGVLSGPVVTNVVAVAWFPDSTRLAVVRAYKYASWTELAQTMPQARRERVESEADKVLSALKAGASEDEAASGIIAADADAIALRLKDLPGAHEALGTNWEKVANVDGPWQQFLHVARLEGGKLSFGPRLGGELDGIDEMRVSPDGKSVAYVMDTTVPETGLELKVAAVDDSRPAQLVDSSVAQFFDWAPDSQSLVYIKAVGIVTNKDELRLASLTRRGVRWQGGAWRIDDNAEDLAATIFNDQAKARCLPDGRILFSGLDLRLPASAAEMPKRQELFAYAPELGGTVIPVISPRNLEKVPEDTSFFEVDPSGRRVSLVVPGLVVVLDLATGELEKAPKPATDDNLFLPVWRGPDELCYKIADGSSNTQAALWRVGTDSTRIISQTWPPEVRKGVLSK